MKIFRTVLVSHLKLQFYLQLAYGELWLVKECLHMNPPSSLTNHNLPYRQIMDKIYLQLAI